MEIKWFQSCHGSSIVDNCSSNNHDFPESRQHLVADTDENVGSTSNKEDSEMQSIVCHIGSGRPQHRPIGAC